MDFESCQVTNCPRAVLCLGVTRERVDEGRLPKEANIIESGKGPAMCWQRPHKERSQSEFIPQRLECNGNVTKRRHGATDRGGTVQCNARSPTRELIILKYDRELLEIHFDKQHDGKKGYRFKESML
ncbi:hypothetical protein BHE74_00038965 [Ensete ventricosum]|nr:hypothetical protein BHE74_00038965 [Ensete ventricosum]RZS09119.1 hypothetical protein BHM03_00040175 [Ensete ventricosum]